MERSVSTASDSGFWTTIDLLIGREWRDREGVDEGDQKIMVAAKGTKRLKGSQNGPGGRRESQGFEDYMPPRLDLSFAGSRVHARLQLLTGSDLVRPTDKTYMHRLLQRIREVNEEALQKRIAAREVDEMDRLKRLILSGRSPIKDCPPELQDHPVFEFWTLVNKEVDKMSKARADAYLKKFRKQRKSKNGDDNPGCKDFDDSSLEIGSEGQLSCDSLKPTPHGESETGDTRRHARYSSAELLPAKYEDEGVKELRELTTVEELYQMADQIIGLPKEEDLAR